MLRIEFGTEDLNRLRLAESVHPLWETALSLQLLQNRHGALVFDPWRRKARADLDDEGLTGTTAALMRICPHAEYFPDFLTPRTGDTSLEAGLDAVLSTPRTRLGQELGRLYPDRCMPASVRRLAEGDLAALHWLGEALRRFHSVAVAPYQDAIRAEVAADLPYRSQAALTSGAEGLLASYQSELIRRDGALECAYPIEWELSLDGRPLHLIPSFFCTRWPVTLADPGLPPVLVLPLAPAPGWLDRTRPPSGTLDSLGRLLGHTRAQVLDVLDRPMSTGGIAAELYLAPASASRHAAVLREAGLISSHRRRHQVLHRRTSLGEALLNGEPGTAK
ncbi:ArsR/SmtB family transcription factor [Streptomyces sp. NPDC088131]|uniref:ArsR/SmtB family transcription factor n=1 Tax=Streptomyces sp. NPDC088131 TaxID=3365826 RepID=UPI003806CA5F